MKRHRTIDRVAAILEFATASGAAGITLSQLPERLDAPKSSVHGLISGLVAAGYIVERGRRYVVGPAPRLLFGGGPLQPVHDAARAQLQRLQEQTGETALLGVRVGWAVMYVDQVESRHLLRYGAPLYERRPLLGSSIGKIFLADLDERDLKRSIRDLPEDIDLDRLRRDLDETRVRGYATNHGETVDGITGVATGIRGPDGHLVAALAVNGPSDRIEPGLDRCTATLLDAVAQVSQRLQPESQADG